MMGEKVQKVGTANPAGQAHHTGRGQANTADRDKGQVKRKQVTGDRHHRAPTEPQRKQTTKRGRGVSYRNGKRRARSTGYQRQRSQEPPRGPTPHERRQATHDEVPDEVENGKPEGSENGKPEGSENGKPERSENARPAPPEQKVEDQHNGARERTNTTRHEAAQRGNDNKNGKCGRPGGRGDNEQPQGNAAPGKPETTDTEPPTPLQRAQDTQRKYGERNLNRDNTDIPERKAVQNGTVIQDRGADHGGTANVQQLHAEHLKDREPGAKPAKTTGQREARPERPRHQRCGGTARHDEKTPRREEGHQTGPPKRKQAARTQDAGEQTLQK